MTAQTLRRTLTISMLAVVLSAAGLLTSPAAKAATGTNLASFDATVTAGIPACGVGTGIAFDGVRLYLSCGGSTVLERVKASGTHGTDTPITVTGGTPAISSIDALAYDGTAGGGKIWACNSFSDVYLISLTPAPPALATSASATFKFTTTNGCRDGLGFDGTGTPSIWASGDASDSIQHYGLSGVPIPPVTTTGLVSALGGNGNSGIAVGGSTLYLANDGGEQIYQCLNKATVLPCTLMSTFTGHRIEDLECDSVTFPGKNAIWSQDAFDRILNAWEIPAGTCGVGGIPQPPVGGTTDLETGGAQTAGHLASRSDSSSMAPDALLPLGLVGVAVLGVSAWFVRRRLARKAR